MSIAEFALKGREFKTEPARLSVYCYKCNVTIRKGELANVYDAATLVHFECPKSPHKTFAAHKYGTQR